jgi:hypothetical protein
MKRLITETLLFILLLAAIAGGFEYLFAGASNDVDRRMQLFEQQKKDITRINIGNSHIGALQQYGADSTHCMNLSFGGQDLFHMYTLLKTVIPQAPQLKTIILGLDADLMGYDLVVANERWKDRQYYPYTHELYCDSWSDRIMASSAFFRANRDFRTLKTSGAAASANFIPPAAGRMLSKEGADRAREHSVYKFSKTLISRNTQIMDSICALCNRHKLTLILLSTPKQKCYNENYDQQTRTLATEAIQELTGRQSLRFYNYSEDPRFDESDFADADHLNPKGAHKMITLLVETDSVFTIPAIR